MKKILLVVLTFVAFVLCGCNQSESNSKEKGVEYIIEYKEETPNSKKRGENNGLYFNVKKEEEIISIYYQRVILIDLTCKNEEEKYFFYDLGENKYTIPDLKYAFDNKLGCAITELKQFENSFSFSILTCPMDAWSELQQCLTSYEIKTYTYPNSLYSYVITTQN